jgi:D-3-phosphoglycerate dehydrogenase
MTREAGARPVILVTDVDWAGLEIERGILEGSGYELILAPDSSEETLVALAPQVSIILVCFAKLTPAVIAHATQTTAIFRYGVGVDNIDVEGAAAAGIAVYNVPDYCIDEVADQALMMMLALYRLLPQQLEIMRTGGWSMPNSYPTRLRGLTLGLVGMGRIGQAFARRAMALGMTIVYTSSSRVLPADLSATHIEDLHTFLQASDCVSLHVPLTLETTNLVDATFLSHMTPSSLLLNVSRGGLVDSDALRDALLSGGIAGAGLDGTNPEPLPAEHPLRSLENCMITPHFAYRSSEALTELRQRISQGARAHARGEDPEDFVSRANPT